VLDGRGRMASLGVVVNHAARNDLYINAHPLYRHLPRGRRISAASRHFDGPGGAGSASLAITYSLSPSLKSHWPYVLHFESLLGCSGFEMHCARRSLRLSKSGTRSAATAARTVVSPRLSFVRSFYSLFQAKRPREMACANSL
jgi:hypothetical protein